MLAVTLSLKIRNEHQLKIAEDYIQSAFKGLKVNMASAETTVDGWLQLKFSGEDEKIALNYLETIIGLCPTHVTHLKRFSTVKGYITGLSESKDEIHVDVGLTNPKTFVTIPLQCLQTQLTDGRKIALQKIVELFGLRENMPVTIKTLSVNENRVEAAMAETQLNLYEKWTKSLLDRLIVLGASQQETKKAIKNYKIHNDVIGIETLGIFEHAIICKFGTDAAGLIPKIGKNLQDASLSIFSPKRLLNFFGSFHSA
ncbi:MAG: DUF2110 family protein [Candidatus Bathyarchaeia archaeon]